MDPQPQSLIWSLLIATGFKSLCLREMGYWHPPYVLADISTVPPTVMCPVLLYCNGPRLNRTFIPGRNFLSHRLWLGPLAYSKRPGSFKVCKMNWPSLSQAEGNCLTACRIVASCSSQSFLSCNRPATELCDLRKINVLLERPSKSRGLSRSLARVGLTYITYLFKRHQRIYWVK